jgi:hypothetical protein
MGKRERVGKYTIEQWSKGKVTVSREGSGLSIPFTKWSDAKSWVMEQPSIKKSN